MTRPFDLDAWASLVLARHDGIRVLAGTLLEVRRRGLRARKRELRAAEAELLAAHERLKAARWRMLLAVGRLERACRWMAQVRDVLG